MIKLVVWDLDDTIWQGTYMYDGEKVVACERTVETIREFDMCGVLQSIISRNSPDVYGYVEKLGLDKYFVLPKVNWETKPTNMEQLLNEVHILPKDVVFVDDDARNLEEMKLNFPEIECVHPDFADEFVPEATPSGSNEERKAFFRDEVKRLALGDNFTKMLDLELTVKRPSGPNELDRVVELINRSNQLHATGNRYDSWTELAREKEIFVGYPKDKYGEYGLSLIAACKDNVVEELVVSCRVMDRGLVAPFLRSIQDILGKEIITVIYHPTYYNMPIFNILNTISGDAGASVAVPRISYYGKIPITEGVRVRIE